MVEPAAVEQRLFARGLDTGHLERMKQRIRSHLDEDVAKALFLQVERHPRLEDALVEGDQAVHVGSDECYVMDAVEQPHASPLLETIPRESERQRPRRRSRRPP